MAREDDLIAQYSDMTGESASKARQMLEAFEWDLKAAVEDHYAQGNDSDADQDMDDDDDEEVETTSRQQPQVAGGGYRLGDTPATSQPVAAAPTSSRSAAKPTASGSSNKRFATLGDFSSNARDDSDSEDDGQNMYAGGDKSGLAVQNPGQNSEDLKKKIIDKARKGGKEIAQEEPKKRSHFTGNARTLGGDDAPSREIPAEAAAPSTQRVKRTLHFWQDGFSVDEGELYRFDDPANASILQQIRSGRAPLHIMDVASGQEVDVQVVQHDENYVQPKKQYKPFAGQGNRLGSPTPGIPTASAMPGSFTQDTPAAAPSTSSQPPTSQVDDSKPTVTLRISLGTGTRMTARFNTDQTMGDVYDFTRRAENSGRSFVLQTTFPIKEFSDHSQVLGDIAEFKRGGAVVQKYV